MYYEFLKNKNDYRFLVLKQSVFKREPVTDFKPGLSSNYDENRKTPYHFTYVFWIYFDKNCLVS